MKGETEVGKWNTCKNVILSLAITMLYAIWSKKGLHEVSTLHMWVILIMVWLLFLHGIVYADQEIKRKHDKRQRKRKARLLNIELKNIELRKES